MKRMRSLIIIGATILITIPFSRAQAQDPGSGHNTHPDAKWEVRKEYDEQGNLIYYDSSYIKTWKHFDFPEPGEGYVFEDLDSLFGDFFHFPEGMIEHHPFTFGPFSEFMDSLNLDFFPDSSFFHSPDGFYDGHKEWIESFREEFSFPHDSLNKLIPKWQHLPQQQKKPARTIEI